MLRDTITHLNNEIELMEKSLIETENFLQQEEQHRQTLMKSNPNLLSNIETVINIL